MTTKDRRSGTRSESRIRICCSNYPSITATLGGRASMSDYVARRRRDVRSSSLAATTCCRGRRTRPPALAGRSTPHTGIDVDFVHALWLQPARRDQISTCRPAAASAPPIRVRCALYRSEEPARTSPRAGTTRSKRSSARAFAAAGQPDTCRTRSRRRIATA